MIDSAYSHSCEKLFAKKEKKGSKKQSKLIEFPLCGSYGDLSDIKFNLVDEEDEDDEDYIPGEESEIEDVDELLANDLDGFIVNEEEYELLTRDANSIINQDIDFENSGETEELNSNGKRKRQENSMLRGFVH